MGWISVRNWRKFQHYDPAKRIPPWVKVYTEIMSADAYLQLTAAERGILLGIWLEYASSRCELRDDTLSLTRRLSVKVSKRHLQRLVDAGFLDIVASKTLADGYHDASASRARVETETEKETTPNPNPQLHNGSHDDFPLPHPDTILKAVPQ